MNRERIPVPCSHVQVVDEEEEKTGIKLKEPREGKRHVVTNESSTICSS